ncbi:hypothetical protein [Nocardia noduli]|uniref:hypothetical protein n=1 Tax=Nocardia noduli TaxID=2815722 RepID=UPI001C248CA1|nr:hypothetical protein [Nocardia noduli]
MSFLFGRLPDPDLCPHLPKVRVVEAVATMRREEKLWLVNAVSRGPHVLGEAMEHLLAETDHPQWLYMLEEVFLAIPDSFYLVNSKNRRSPIPDDRLARFLRIVQTNPHIPLPARPMAASGDIPVHDDDVLLAVAVDRLDLVDYYFELRSADTCVRALLRGASASEVPVFADRCRRVLATLESAQARSYLAGHAMGEGYPPAAVAREIVVETGWMWDEDPVLFTFLTEQWDRYDTLDPDGSRLRAFCHSGTRDANFYRSRIEKLAHRTHRANPYPPLPPERIWDLYDDGLSGEGGCGGGGGGGDGGGCGGGD